MSGGARTGGTSTGSAPTGGTAPGSTAPGGAEIRVEGLSVARSGRTVIRDLSFTVAAGEIVTVLGPSGCGKSTLLRVLAGLQPASSGAVLVGGAPVTGPDASRAMAFQDDALLPWRSVRRNVELPLQLQGVGRAERRARAGALLASVGMADSAQLLPKQLSGGMRQRAQIARTLVSDPRVVLMDEPFSALDVHSRRAAQDVLLEQWGRSRPTVVFVTHDVDEAVRLGQRVLVLSAGPASIALERRRPEPTGADHADRLRAHAADLTRALAARPAQPARDGQPAPAGAPAPSEKR
ncbi:ABC transporter ATP-binding protein [Rathayibacter sp. VKM Ac-2856]|uniref:ABC transporter ATP-binding protein n=1 Tax=unclassified Rathayibacter TaxID=2609250 RepID=UPI001564CC56|nr:MULTISPECIES: ABC transporter ATP-binding protein [unclassified Rathayibacter]NQX05171.1 ABC transporter ATP-binding protein [Rathayibacter sp. VKM Ac-2858]NQX20338.1 ABC transporter ATP-binding protein [Rathayibacter sp. VKM Ac-2856]